MFYKKEKKDYVFKRLDALLKPQGYRVFNKRGAVPTYLLNKEDIGVRFYFAFKDAGDIDISELQVSIKIVEEITLEIGHPEDIYSDIDYKKNILPTIVDNFEIPGLYRGIGYRVNTQKDLETFTNFLVHYLETDAPKFIETYTYLPNVLKKMDELTAQGKYWHEILSGSADYLFRGLIISKLCNDPNYNEKIKYTDKLFYDKPDEWIPYYEKLKERLKSVEPKYNI
ncbi:hypothetical protein EDL98_04835 [Ornithobacterium rhinotracheale]|uniref:hypothetical protein n=1 Tax=Ornithobacterium rhinotracheale TaxID=28251 RepID=UPI00129C9B18|nr:hypothetical protein [Ornithobacterium rhinotracheale]MRJ10405.1 hypothetical protein [Ornithobacterium rhinotracheale]